MASILLTSPALQFLLVTVLTGRTLIVRIDQRAAHVVSIATAPLGDMSANIQRN